MLAKLAAAFTIATGCANSSEVVPDVVEAEIGVDRSAPDELATIDIGLELHAGSRANHNVELLDAVLLYPTHDRPGITMKLALPTGNLVLAPDDETMVYLVNVGTTNADLTIGCGKPFDVLVSVLYLDEPEHGFADVEPTVVTIACH